jgi:hypothetical protein
LGLDEFLDGGDDDFAAEGSAVDSEQRRHELQHLGASPQLHGSCLAELSRLSRQDVGGSNQSLSTHRRSSCCGLVVVRARVCVPVALWACLIFV